MIGFAHRGAPAPYQRENTLPAFRRALAAGVAGVESDVWITADGVPVLHHDPVVGVRRRRLTASQARDLPAWIPSLPRFYAEVGAAFQFRFQFSLDIKGHPGSSRQAAAAVIAAARAAGGSAAVRRLWLCGSLPALRVWRELDDEVRLVNSTDLQTVTAMGGFDACARTLRAAGVDALNLRSREWKQPTARLVDVLHAHGLAAFGWDAQTTRTIRRLAGYGLDAVYCDHLARLVRLTGTDIADVPSPRPGQDAQDQDRQEQDGRDRDTPQPHYDRADR